MMTKTTRLWRWGDGEFLLTITMIKEQQWTKTQDHQDQEGNGTQLLVVATRKPPQWPRPQDHENHGGNGGLMVATTIKKTTMTTKTTRPSRLRRSNGK